MCHLCLLLCCRQFVLEACDGAVEELHLLKVLTWTQQQNQQQQYVNMSAVSIGQGVSPLTPPDWLRAPVQQGLLLLSPCNQLDMDMLLWVMAAS